MSYATINEQGLQQIRAALEQHAKAHPITDTMVQAYATDAENNHANGNGARFEIGQHYSLTGRPVIVEIDAHGFDISIDGEDARAKIKAAVQAAGKAAILETVAEMTNTTENDIDEDGDVWVCNPQTGHWLSDEKLVELASRL